MRPLIKQCGDFASKVEKISLIENQDPVLKQISEAKSFDDGKEIAEKHFEFLGKGSARAAFKINDELVLKVAIDTAGIAQNKSEMRPELQKSCSTNVIAACGAAKWLIIPFTEKLTEKKFKEINGVGFDEFMACLYYAYNNESDERIPKEYDRVKHMALFECVGQIIIDGSLLLGDISKISSWGLDSKGKSLLRDLGFSKQVYEQEYKDSDDSSSSSSGLDNTSKSTEESST